MKKSHIKTMPEYFDRYIKLVEDVDVVTALEKYGARYFMREREQLELMGNRIYAPGKWTIKDILQHIIDTERVFAYRALRFARQDDTELAGYDENIYAEQSGAINRTLGDLFGEYEAVGKSTVYLFKSFNEQQLLFEGTCFGKKMSPLAIGFCLAGHAIHHMKVIRERYYPLLD